MTQETTEFDDAIDRACRALHAADPTLGVFKYEDVKERLEETVTKVIKAYKGK